MALSVLDLFSVGIGPSVSHTVGPMRAAAAFAAGLKGDGATELHVAGAGRTVRLARRYRRGHGTDKAVVLGLQGETRKPWTPPRPTTRWPPPHRRRISLGGRHGWTSTGTRTWSCTAASRCPATPTA